MKYLFIALILTGLISQVSAQEIIFGNSISLLAPTGDFGDIYKGGFGINANFEAKFSKLAAIGEFGYSGFVGDGLDGSNDDAPELKVWNLLVGAKFSLAGPFYLEGRTGYYFGDVDEFVIIPAAGLRLKRFDLNAGYQILGDFNFLDIRVGYFWGGSK